MKSDLKRKNLILSILIIPICLLILLVDGWGAYSTITERSGIYGDMYSYYKLTRIQYFVYTALAAGIAFGFIVFLFLYFIKKDNLKLKRTQWTFLVFIGLIIVCEVFLQFRFEGKP